MASLILKWKWRFESSSHVGTGLARAGYADRLIRVDRDGRPHLPGDAVKGAIRGTVERVCRWLVPEIPKEPESSSLPQHPALFRLFARDAMEKPHPASYHFDAAACREDRGRHTLASTAIEPESGVAQTDTLRIVEAAGEHLLLESAIRASGGLWEQEGSDDRLDLLLLVCGLIGTEAVAGKRSVGFGRVQLANFDTVPEIRIGTGTLAAALKDPDQTRNILEDLRLHLKCEVNLQ